MSEDVREGKMEAGQLHFNPVQANNFNPFTTHFGIYEQRINSMAAVADLLHHGHHGHGSRAGVIRVPEPSDQRLFPVSPEKDNDLRNNSNE